MQRFSYNAKSLAGELRSGVMDAENQSEVAKALRQEGFILVSAELAAASPKISPLSLNIFGKVSLADKIMFCRNLGVMIKAGISIPRALKILSRQTKSRKFSRVLLEISDEITKGNNLSDCLARHPDIFSELFSSMVKVGEEAGTLEESLNVLTKQMEKSYELKSKVKGALAYPIVILCAMAGIGVLMLIMVVPRIAETFAELGVELPFTTRIVIAMGTFAAAYWFLLPIIFFAVYFVFFKLIPKIQAGKLVLDTLSLKMPGISGLIKKSNSASAIRTLSSLISSGVPIVRSLELVSSASGNLLYRQALKEITEDVKKGAKLSDGFSKHQNIFSLLIVQMTEVGEETGETGEILGKLADFYEEEVANAAKTLSTIIEPILMIVIGIVVGFFVISMVQPMYGMMNNF